MFIHLESRNSVFEPVRRGVALEVEVEEFTHADRVVLLVLRLREPMVLADVLEQYDVLAELTKCVEERDALIEVDGTITLVMQQKKRRLDLVGVERRRV